MLAQRIMVLGASLRTMSTSVVNGVDFGGQFLDRGAPLAALAQDGTGEATSNWWENA